MSQHDRDLLTACSVMALAVFIFWTSWSLPMRGDLIESPAIFPGLMSIVLFIFGGAYAIRSLLRGGRMRISAFVRSVAPALTSEKNRPAIFGVFFPGIYVFVAIPLIGFYISSALFMSIMFYAYVKRWRRWFFLPVAIGITACLYLIFSYLFMSQIW